MSDNSLFDELHIYPELFSKDILVKELEKHGLDEDLLNKIKDNIGELLKCFYENLSSLPRRSPRQNRRGKQLKKLHVIEDRKTSLKLSTLNINTFEKQCCVSSRKGKNNPENTVNSRNMSSMASSTPEMDRLAERSKLAAKAMLNSSKDLTRIIDKHPKKMKLSSKNVKSTDSIEPSTKKEKESVSKSLPLESSVLIRNDCSTNKTESNLNSIDVAKSSKMPVQLNGDESSKTDADAKTQNNALSSQANKIGRRKKINRNSFSSNSDDCKRAKIS